MRRAFCFAHSLGLLALILLGVFVSSCSPTPAGETYSPLSSTASLDAGQSPLATPTPQATLTPTCNPPWPTPPSEACSWLPTPEPTPTSPFPTPTPFVPPTPSAQTPTPLPLLQAATSPAGTILYAVFFAPGTAPSEPEILQVTVDQRGQVVTPPVPFIWTTLDDNRMVVGRLTVSPNGAYLTSAYDTEAGESVVIVDLATAQETSYVWGGQFFNWHPNGVEFLFEQSSQANPGLWLVEAHTGRYRLLAQPAALNYTNLSGAAISPDGRILAYSISGPGIEQIWMANADGSEPHLVLESNTSAIVYAWSPDERYLLYGGEPMPEAGKGTPLPPWPRLWVMDREGQNRRSLNLPWDTSGFTDQKPVWSPTGQYIAGIGGVGETIRCWRPGENQPVDPLCLFRNAGVYVENVETGEVRLVASNAVDPTWSPDGSLLALSRMDERGQVDIWIVDVSGDNLRRVTDTPELDRYPIWLQMGQ